MLIWKSDTPITWCLLYKYVRLVLGKGAHELSWQHAQTMAIKKTGHTDPTTLAQVDTDLLCAAHVFQIPPATNYFNAL